MKKATKSARNVNPDSLGDEPYVGNYPTLRDWLTRHNARCDWQSPIGPKHAPNAYVEQWSASNGRTMIITIFANGHGWNVYTAIDSNKIDATFEDAEERLKLLPRDVRDTRGHGMEFLTYVPVVAMSADSARKFCGVAPSVRVEEGPPLDPERAKRYRDGVKVWHVYVREQTT